MKILTHNHAFAQAESVFLKYTSVHFVRVLSKYAIYPNMIGSTLSARVSRSLTAPT